MSAPEWLAPLAFSMAFTLASMWMPIWLGVREAPARPHYWARAGLVVLLVVSNLIVAAIVGDLDSQAISAMLAVSSAYAAAPIAIFLAFPLIVWLLYDAGIGDAMYVSAQGYALQNLASGLMETLRLLAGAPTGSLELNITWTLVSAISYATVYACFFRLVRPRQASYSSWRASGRGMVVAMALVVFLVIFFDEVIKALTMSGASVPFLLALRTIHVGTCLFVLWSMWGMVYSQEMRRQVEAERAMRAEEERRWELSQANVEAINVKCHDIRHQIRQLRDGSAGVVDASVLDDIEREVEVYDSQVRTGNAALDTILSEKRLLCDQAGVELSVMADGEALASMSPTDLYALFGNALDNALEAARKVEEGRGRYISVVVRRAAGMVVVHVENSFAGEAPTFVDGLPQTTKADRANHGFGTLSVRRIAERYGGTATMACQGQVFTLDVLLASTA